MKYLKSLIISAVTTLALTVFFAAATASATELYSTGVTQNAPVTLELTLQSSTSLLFKDTSGSTNDTCTNSTTEATTNNTGGSGVAVTASVNTLNLSGCSHTSDALINADSTFGKLELKWTSGTKATLISKESRVTNLSTVFGISCTMNTGAGTVLGTVETTAGSTAVLRVNAVISLGAFCGDSTMTGTYNFTKPDSMTIEDK